MDSKVKMANEYLDYIIMQLEQGNTEKILECRNAIDSIFFDRNKLDEAFLSVIPIDKLDGICNFLIDVKTRFAYIDDKKIRNQYIEGFKNISQILKESIMDSVSDIEYKEENHMQKEYDVFVSHANMDKLDYVDALYESIKKLGIKIFYDKEEISWGDNWKEKILNGTKCSEFAIIVISKNFFGREWTEKELSEFLNRQNKNGQKIILPLVHEIELEELSKRYPKLSELQVLRTCDITIERITILLAKELIKRYKNNI